MKNKIGIVGGGQLGRMLAFEAKKMGFYVTVTDPTLGSPAGQVVDEQILGGYSDAEATKKLAAVSDFITFEIEHINTGTLQELVDNGAQIHPSPQTIAIIKDKFQQKVFLRLNKIPTATFVEVATEHDILSASKKFGFPLVLKAKHDAFDGRGNVLIKNKNEIASALKKLKGRHLYVEKFVRFKKELAINIARSTKGEIVSYPVVETIHVNNICHIVKAPAQIDKKIRDKSEKFAIDIMKHLKGAGVFAIEMFLTKDNKILVNEIAPRVHNSGHYTIEACATSQFEQHIRAITGLPLGNPEMIVPASVMINILGRRQGAVEIANLEKVLRMPNVFVHIYGKKETKPERKMGHITVIGKSMKEVLKKAVLARKYLSI